MTLEKLEEILEFVLVVMVTFACVAILMALLTGCTPRSSSSTAYDSSADTCDAACVHRVELDCVDPTVVEPCVDVCIRAAKRGMLDPACIVRAASASELVKCHGIGRCKP